MRILDSFTYPLQSSRLGVFSAERLSQIQRWPITEMKSKAVCLPKNVDNQGHFHIYPLIMQKN